MRILGALLAALGLLASAAIPAAAAPRAGKPDLAPAGTVASPTGVAVGERVEVRGRIANRGMRIGRGRVEVFLSPRASGRGGRAALGAERIAVGGRSAERFSVSGRVPDGLDSYEEGSTANRFYAVACVRRRGERGPRRCDTAARATRVEVFSPGERSLGQPLFPQLGNGGYDAESYAIALAYDPGDQVPDSSGDADVDQSFEPGTSTTMTATATQNLSRFSLDFQRFDVSSVLVDGQPAEFRFADTAPFADPGEQTQFTKLVVTPAGGILDGEEFTVEVDYTGTPRAMIDADDSREGWIQACYATSDAARTCDGSFTVNEPNGTQTWAPVNNVPSDKATVETEITVPSGLTALGAGEQTSAPLPNGDGTTTWSWSLGVPTSPYLLSATVGDFDLTESQMIDAVSGAPIGITTAIDGSATEDQQAEIGATFGEIPEVQNYLAQNVFGAFPYSSTGGVADRTDNVFYALENATKPHYAGRSDGPAVGAGTQVHELAHQWMGDSVGPATWLDIGFNEGWATWATWEYQGETGVITGDPPRPARSAAELADLYYENTKRSEWAFAPAAIEDPAELFESPVYDRTAAMIQYTREILGDDAFGELTRTITSEYAGDVISWRQFAGEAVAASGFGARRSKRLRSFFDQWLYGTERPTLTARTF